MVSVTPRSSATSWAEETNETRASTPDAPIRSPSTMCSARRSSILCEWAGNGAAPLCASTTSRCKVLDPTSSTPRRTGSIVGCGCAPRVVRGGGDRRTRPRGHDGCKSSARRGTHSSGRGGRGPRVSGWLLRRRRRSRLRSRSSSCAATRCRWTSRARGSSSPTRATPTSSSAATSPGSRAGGPACTAAAATASTAPSPTTAAACSGAHFSDKDDERKTKSYAEQLTPETWQYHQQGTGKKGVTEKDEDGAPKTRVVDGACVFLNRTGFSGGAGCALHQLAERIGKQPLEVKPDVCWQLPVRRTFDHVERPDGTAILVISITRVRPARVGRRRARPGLVLHRLDRRPRRPRAGLSHRARHPDRAHGPSGVRACSRRTARRAWPPWPRRAPSPPRPAPGSPATPSSPPFAPHPADPA